MSFRLLKSDCPICGGIRNGKKKNDCKQSGELIHCFSHNDPPLGYVCTGQSAIGQSLYAPAKGDDYDPEKQRAELAKLRAENQAREAKRRAELPTIGDRHQEILKFKAELTPAQNADLLRRGLFQDEIDFALANHWIFAHKGGYGISAIDPVTGLFCGAQRAKDDRSPKYDWGIFTGQNKLKETDENPLAVWRSPDFDETKPYEIEIGEKFLGSLIRALVQWRKNPQTIVIGAAGGLFGENLRRAYAPFPKPKSITFFPDAGSQDLKKLNLFFGYKEAVRITHEVYGNGCNDPQLKFADHGQWRDKSKGDYDEYFGRYKRRKPWDWLRFFSFEETRKRAKERLKTSDKLTPDIVITHEQLQQIKEGQLHIDQLTNGARDVDIHAGRGAGKTETAKTISQDWERAIAPFHRKALAQDGGGRMGMTYRTDCDVMNGQLIGSSGFINRIAYCNEAYLSLERPIDALLNAEASSVTDEIDQQIKNLVLSSTHGKKGQRKLHWDGFWKVQTRAVKTLSMSADITDFEVSLQHKLTGRKPFVIKVQHQQKARIDTVFEDSAQWWANFLQLRFEGKRLLVVCTRRSDTEFFKSAFNAIAIHAYNSSEYQDFINDADTWLSKNKPRLLVVSPILGTGFSIKGDHFDAVLGLFHADNLSAKDLMQFLDRYRPNVPRYIWCAESNYRYDQLTPDAVFKARMARARANKDLFDSEVSWINKDDAYFHYKAESNWSLAHLRADLLARLERDTEKVNYVLDDLSKEEKDAINQQITDLRKAFNDADYLKTKDADDLTRDEYLALLEREENLSESERRAIAKFEIADWAGMTPDQLDFDYIKRDRHGKKRKALEKLEQQAFPKIAEALDKASLEKQIKHGISQQDLTHNLVRVRTFEDIGIGEILDFVLNGGVWHSEHPIVKETAEILRSNRAELVLMGISLTCGENASDNAYFGCLLKGFGLTTTAPTDGTPKQPTIDGKKVRNYTLCSEDLELTKRDLIARLPRNIEKFGELTVKPENQWVQGLYGGHTPFENITLTGVCDRIETPTQLSFGDISPPPPPEPAPDHIPSPAPMPTAIAPIITTPKPVATMTTPTIEPPAPMPLDSYKAGDKVRFRGFYTGFEWMQGTVEKFIDDAQGTALRVFGTGNHWGMIEDPANVAIA